MLAAKNLQTENHSWLTNPAFPPENLPYTHLPLLAAGPFHSQGSSVSAANHSSGDSIPRWRIRQHHWRRRVESPTPPPVSRYPLHFATHRISLWRTSFYHIRICASAAVRSSTGGVIRKNVFAASGSVSQEAICSFRSTSGIR